MSLESLSQFFLAEPAQKELFDLENILNSRRLSSDDLSPFLISRNDLSNDIFSTEPFVIDEIDTPLSPAAPLKAELSQEQSEPASGSEYEENSEGTSSESDQYSDASDTGNKRRKRVVGLPEDQRKVRRRNLNREAAQKSRKKKKKTKLDLEKTVSKLEMENRKITAAVVDLASEGRELESVRDLLLLMHADFEQRINDTGSPFSESETSLDFSAINNFFKM